VSLWDLLIALCWAMPVAGALASARLARVGFFGYALTLVAGLVLGLGCAYILRTAGKTAVDGWGGNSTSTQEWYFRALYFVAVMWIVLALFLGAWASSAMLRPYSFCASVLSFSQLPLPAV
jgi:hypothetical protein